MSFVTPQRLKGLGIAFGVMAMDQIVKWFVLNPLQLRNVGVIDLLPFFDLRYAENRGISYGFLTAETLESRIFLFLLTGTIALGVLIWMFRETRMGDIAALALVLGGALGNIIDRVRFTYVVDYADFHIGAWRPFAVFNLADAAITAGVVLLLARSLLIREKPKGDDDFKAAAATERR
ncbi:signal peptidase II [Croceicoccus naphthovorans]|uniref:Lipoprotein signal peptidase n=1 Tax=Croceicoccus naphthovorans TaxID=1348774 RepID=A0A0G3XBJ9_9SPHN|nr:signal peptidase II [Croceicoccus naphthovorans]AKM08935.1 peptidase A8 [Croceicoccus naphthovorans]MBB3989278.1 signal peptidase II [Croceicoccus naphthovorans]